MHFIVVLYCIFFKKYSAIYLTFLFTVFCEVWIAWHMQSFKFIVLKNCCVNWFFYFTHRGQAGQLTTMSCGMRTTSRLITYKPWQTIFATRNSNIFMTLLFSFFWYNVWKSLNFFFMFQLCKVHKICLNWWVYCFIQKENKPIYCLGHVGHQTH